MISKLMKQGSTILLRGAVLVIGLLALAFCTVALPFGIFYEDRDVYTPILIGLYLPAIPFFIALYQTLKLLNYIDKNQAFSRQSINTLNVIKYCALTVGGLFTAGMPYIFYAANEDDAPGVIVIGLVIIFAAVVVAVFAAVLQKLLQNAMDIKSENDLTV